MKIKEIVKQILKEESDSFDWIYDYGITPEEGMTPDVLMLLIRKELKDKKSYTGKNYVVDKEEGHDGYIYFIGEKNKDGSVGYFIYENKDDFNLKYLEPYISEVANGSTRKYSEGLISEYRKLYEDLKPLFVV